MSGGFRRSQTRSKRTRTASLRVAMPLVNVNSVFVRAASPIEEEEKALRYAIRRRFAACHSEKNRRCLRQRQRRTELFKTGIKAFQERGKSILHTSENRYR
ncbi:hypothetical protein [Nostoc sp.]|uniref:hypothetical protein n=1 Tax=Nostoc sp. TaxID=1180 RepID=UPI002FFA8361